MIAPETLAAAARVAQHGARLAMLAARRETIDADQDDGDALVMADSPGAAPVYGIGLHGTGPAPARGQPQA